MIYRENGQFVTSYVADERIFPVAQDRWLVAALLVLAFLVIPAVASEYVLRAILTPFLILSLAALGLNLLVGYCGQMSLGTGAFMSIGAYATYNITTRLEWISFIPAVVLGAAIAMAVGVLFGIPSLRIRGLYLAVSTLAVQFFCDWAFLRIRWLTGDTASGTVSAGTLLVFGAPVVTPAQKYLLCLAFTAPIALMVKNVVRGALGREWMAMRDMDVAAAVIGIRPTQAKLSAFAASSFIVGIAGSLWAFVHLGSWEPAAFGVDRSFQLLFIIIIGGLGSISGSFIGAAFMVLLPLALNQAVHLLGLPIASGGVSHIESMLFGCLIVFFLVVEPHGLARLCAIGREKLRLWPFPH
jgi:branched-chain amino acid transport system permease protein